MNGERGECPVVPNVAIQLNLGHGARLLVAASCDSIQMFPDPRYTHLRFWDTDDSSLKALFLPEDAIEELADSGIPITIRESITEGELASWAEFMGRAAMAGIDQEIDDLLG